MEAHEVITWTNINMMTIIMNRWKLNKYHDYNIVNRVKAHEVQPEPPEQRPREKSRNQERININKGRIHEDQHGFVLYVCLSVRLFIYLCGVVHLHLLLHSLFFPDLSPGFVRTIFLFCALFLPWPAGVLGDLSRRVGKALHDNEPVVDHGQLEQGYTFNWRIEV